MKWSQAIYQKKNKVMDFKVLTSMKKEDIESMKIYGQKWRMTSEIKNTLEEKNNMLEEAED